MSTPCCYGIIKKKTMATKEPKEVRISLRVPTELHNRLWVTVQRRRIKDRHFSVNKWLNEAVEEKLQRESKKRSEGPESD